MATRIGRFAGTAGLAALLSAIISVEAGAAGETSLDFLRLDVGPRQVAMGGAAAAVGGDAYGMTYNPALLASLGAQEAAFSHAQWLQSITYQDFLYAHPLSWGTLGGRVQRLGYGDINAYDAAGAKAGSFSASDLLLGGGYAKSFPKSGLSLGGQVKIARRTIGAVSAQAVLFDLGAAFTPRRRGLLGDATFGLSARNLGSSVKFDRVGEPVPTEVLAGAALKWQDGRLLTSVDGRFPLAGGPGGRLGAEFWLMPNLALRAGLDINQSQGPGVRAGLGFLAGRGVVVDYAFLPMGELGMTHQIGVRLTFGGPAEKSYREGLRLMHENKPADAVLKFNEALNLNPKHPEAGRRLKQAYEKMRGQESSQEP